MGPQIEGVVKGILETTGLYALPGMVGCIGRSVCVALQIYERGEGQGRGGGGLQLSSSVDSLCSFTDFALSLLPRESA